MSSIAAPTWACDRSAHLKSLLPSNSSIQISSGGGINLTSSLSSWTACDSIDIVSVHDYGTDIESTIAAIVLARQNAAKGQSIILGEWGIKGDNKAALVKQFVDRLGKASISWMYWEVVKPGKALSDFEVRITFNLSHRLEFNFLTFDNCAEPQIWTDEPAWSSLTSFNRSVAVVD